MTGDRRLTEFELAQGGLQSFALETIRNQGTEPTLHDMALIEAYGKIDAQREALVKLLHLLQEKKLITAEEFNK